MILKELLDKVKDIELLCYLNRIGDTNNLYAYKEMLQKLRKLPIRVNDENKDLKIVVIEERNLFSEDDSVSLEVYGVVEGKEDCYALEFMSWDLWLGSEVVEKSLDKFGRVAFVSECLYEMSFYDFDEEKIQGKIEELKEMETAITEGTVKTYSSEEVREHLGIKDYKEPTDEEKEAILNIMRERNSWNMERRKEILV